MKTKPVNLWVSALLRNNREFYSVTRGTKVLTCIVALVVMAVSGAYGSSSSATNVILFIGDGMGFQQVRAGAYYKGSPLCFEAWTNAGAVRTSSYGEVITDSAAAATAMATGNKVYNEVVSVANPGDMGDRESVLEFFKRKGKRTGLVTTSTITHATPACFGAHAASRSYTGEIASDYLSQSRPNVIFGGGGDGMTSNDAVSAGYTVVINAAGLSALDAASETMVSGQFGFTLMPYEYDGLGVLPHLSQMTAKALEILAYGTNGFFLMVEGGMIDPACHANDITRCVREVVEFDNSVQVVLNWISNRTDTLVMVTADHETGGMISVINNGSGVDPSVTWTSGGGHTASNVGVWATGPRAGFISGEIENTELFRIMRKAYFLESGGGAPEKTGDNFSTTWSARPGDVYRLESADSPAAQNWSQVAVATASLNSISITDTNAAAFTRRYYRLGAVD